MPEIKLGDHLPITESESGYKTSETPYRFDISPFRAMLHCANITYEGAKTHGDDNWRKGSVEAHVDKAIIHAFAWLAGDRSEDHLGHLAWRGLAACEIGMMAEKEKPPV